MRLSSLARRIGGLLLLTLLARCSQPEGVVDCSLKMVAQMPLEVEDHLLVVPAGINGKWVKLIVDTGAERTTIAASTAADLGLPHDPRYTTRSLGVGGVSTTTDVRIDRMVLGGVHFPVNRVAVGTFQLQNMQGLDADGLLGADILLAFDMDIDVPDRTLTLYHAMSCPDIPFPWKSDAVEIPGVRARKDRLLMPFELDDVSGLAILDTGAQRDVLGVDMARRIGLNDQNMATDPTIRQHGVGPAETIAHLHKFSILRIGPVVEQPAMMTVMDSEAGVGDALMGEQFLAGRRVWMSFRSRQIYVSQPKIH